MRLMALSLVLMLMIGFLPIGILLSHILENRFPTWNPARGAPYGIVILGGAIEPALSQNHHTVALNNSAERVTVIAAMPRCSRAHAPKPILSCPCSRALASRPTE